MPASCWPRPRRLWRHPSGAREEDASVPRLPLLRQTSQSRRLPPLASRVADPRREMLIRGASGRCRLRTRLIRRRRQAPPDKLGRIPSKKEAHFLAFNQVPSPNRVSDPKSSALRVPAQLGLTSGSDAVDLGVLIDHDKITEQLR